MQSQASITCVGTVVRPDVGVIIAPNPAKLPIARGGRVSFQTRQAIGNQSKGDRNWQPLRIRRFTTLKWYVRCQTAVWG